MESAPSNNKILIVDDDKFLLDMYALKFKEQQFETIVAFNAAEALEKIDKGLDPHICLVDIIMPGMNGFDLVAELRKRPSMAKATIVILSNLGQKEDIEKGLSVGADGYIVKASATPSEVVKKVLDIVNHK